MAQTLGFSGCACQLLMQVCSSPQLQMPRTGLHVGQACHKIVSQCIGLQGQAQVLCAAIQCTEGMRRLYGPRISCREEGNEGDRAVMLKA